MSWGQMITKSYVFGAWIFIDRQVPSILTGVSLVLKCLSGRKWLIYTTGLWPWPSRSDTCLPFARYLGIELFLRRARVHIVPLVCFQTSSRHDKKFESIITACIRRIGGWRYPPPVLTWDGGTPPNMEPDLDGGGGTPTGTVQRVLATRRAVCLLRPRRRTLLFNYLIGKKDTN